MDESLVLAAVQMTPCTFRRMVIDDAFSHAMLAAELRGDMLQPNVHTLFTVIAFDTRYTPWRRWGEDALIKGYKVHMLFSV